MKRIQLILLLVLGLVYSINCKSNKYHDAPILREANRMEIKTTDELVIYYPQFKRIDLVCGNMPLPADTTAIFCCAAAFTGELLDSFNHKNIAGHHVSRGKFYKGYTCKHNTGCFTYYDNSWNFLFKNYINDLKYAAKRGGMGFSQNMIVYNFKAQPSFRKSQSKFQYRALCEKEGKLCVVESRHVMTYKEFIQLLEDLHVKYAMYLDMGRGWNHSWYRDNDSKTQIIHPKCHSYSTNWIVFFE